MNDKFWHLEIDSKDDCLYLYKILLDHKFNIWRWSNCWRITFRGKMSTFSFLCLKEDKMLNFRFSQSPFLDPTLSSIASKVTLDNYKYQLVYKKEERYTWR